MASAVAMAPSPALIETSPMGGGNAQTRVSSSAGTDQSEERRYRDAAAPSEPPSGGGDRKHMQQVHSDEHARRHLQRAAEGNNHEQEICPAMYVHERNAAVAFARKP
jgi:hypothetical protein